MIGAGVGFGLWSCCPVELPLLALRRPALLHRARHGVLRLAEPGRSDEQPAGRAPGRRGSGMNTTFQNSAQVLSIGIFFTLMIIGLSGSLPASLYHGLVSHGVPTASAQRISTLSPVSTLFASLLGYNPVQELLGPHVLSTLPHTQQVALTVASSSPR